MTKGWNFVVRFLTTVPFVAVAAVVLFLVYMLVACTLQRACIGS